MIHPIRAIREAAFLYRREQVNRAALKPLLYLELREYTRDQCVLAALDGGVPADQIGVVGISLWNRTGRGKTTLAEAVKRYHTTNGDLRCES